MDNRIAQSGDYLIATEGTFSDVNKYIEQKEYIDVNSLFGNDNNIELDLGCGLGSFAILKAMQNKNINYIAVEKFSNIIIGAIEKAREGQVKNLKFINCRVECIEKFIKDESVSTIYLNFSNPLPSSTDEKQRLTSQRFLNIYKKILKNDGKIEQKTDDLEFFEYSIESFKKAGFRVENICYDVSKANIEGNVITEHEEKYMKMGKKINRLEAYKC